jgi:hypothetical protein
VEEDGKQEAGSVSESPAVPPDLWNQLNPWCEGQLGSSVAEVLFVVRRLGTVFGVTLSDGRRVAIKLGSAKEPIDRRRATQRVQTYLYREGFPCPRPILGPRPFGSEVGVVEELVEAGAAPNAHEPKIRRAMAEGLAWQMRITSAIDPPEELKRRCPPWIDLRTAALWPPPHHPRLNFVEIEPVMGWVDQIAARAKRIFLERDDGNHSTAHSDWEAHNIRCSNQDLVVAYDWDSLAVESELALVGRAAAVFTAHTDPRFGYAPSPVERWGFISEFEEAAERRFTDAERIAITAVSAWATAYEARLAHAFEPERGDRPGSFSEALSELDRELR